MAMKDDTDLLFIQSRLVARLMELYDSTRAEKEQITQSKRAQVEKLVMTIVGQVTPFMDAIDEGNKEVADIEREAARKQYEQWASIVVEMIPLLADAIALRLQGLQRS